MDIGRTLGFSGTIIEDACIAAIHDSTVDIFEKLKLIFSEGGKLCPGIVFDFDSGVITFKFFQGEPISEKVQAYTQFVALLNHTAKTLKYASSKSKEYDNDKFTFRLFLIRLGFVGDSYKLARKILLSQLGGNSAFRNGSKPEKANVST